MMIAGNETTFKQKKERKNVPSLHVFWGKARIKSSFLGKTLNPKPNIFVKTLDFIGLAYQRQIRILCSDSL
jgi:hypothetical protein